MLRELKIENLALVENLDLIFDGSAVGNTVEPSGLTVLTGETGAGKSIILQAIHLLSGGKVPTTLIRSGAAQASVEALFEISPSSSELLDRLNDMGFNAEDGLVLKRIITENNRSSYYVNGGLATAKVVAKITENLYAIASQHDHQLLLSSQNHLGFVDTVGELQQQCAAFSECYHHWQAARAEYEKLKKREHDRGQHREFLAHQCSEIRDAGISEKDENLPDEMKRLKSADRLRELGWHGHTQLTEQAGHALAEARKCVRQMQDLDPGISELAEKITEFSYQAEDFAAQLRDYVQDIPSDPAQMEYIGARLDLLQRLKRKYAGTGGGLADIILFAEQAERELAELDNMQDALARLAGSLQEQERKIMDLAAELTKARQKVAGTLAKKMRTELRSLYFDHPTFEISFADTPKELAAITRSGWDRVEFLFSANPGEPVKPLAQIASGGELSRLMLALKCLLAKKDQVETVIFDEVDAGIGGGAAEAIGRKIKELSSHHQVLCITHLAQIASHADTHFLVSKSIHNRRTLTAIHQLDSKERTGELARMVAGKSITDRTLAFAEELIKGQ